MINNPQKKHRIMLILQYWEGDKEQAMRLARLIGKMKTSRDNADLILMSRRDTKESKEQILVMQECVKSMPTYLRRGSRTETGYPGGCNALWCDSMHFTALACRKGAPHEDITCVLCFEPDCVPLKEYWADDLLEAYIKDPCLMMGNYIPHGPPHINGNAVFDPMLFRKASNIHGFNIRAPWDTSIWPMIHNQSRHTPLIRSEWKREKPLTPKEIENSYCSEDWNGKKFDGKPVLFHGYKGNELLEWAENKFT